MNETTKSLTYGVLGAGMQGTAAAYDLVRFASPELVRFGDAKADHALRAAERVNRLVGRHLCAAAQVDAMNPESLREWLKGVDVLLSCVPYWMHPQIADVAIAAGVHMCDLGGNTEVTWQTLAKDEEARGAGVTLVPDCGLAPGLVNSVGLALIERLDRVDSVRLYCGVLPQHPKPPFHYKLTFNVEGLVTEYDYQAVVLRGGEITHVETLTELEELDIPELGRMEAFVTSGGTSTAPYSLQECVRDYEYKTLRFPGHCERMRLFKDFGLWREDEVEVPGGRVRPKDVFCKVFGPALARFEDRDQCAVRGVAVGQLDGAPKTVTLDLFDRQCEETGFTAMERLTGYSLSILAQHVAAGHVPSGAVRYERAMPGGSFLAELAKRGIVVKES